MISFVTIFYTAIITLACIVAFLQLYVYYRLKDSVSRLFLSAAALAAGAQAIFELLFVNMSNAHDVYRLVKWQQIPVAIIVVGLIWFLYFHFDKKYKPWVWAVTGLWSIFILVNLVMEGNILYREITAMKPMQIWGGETIYIAEGIINPLKYLAEVASLIFIIYTGVVSISAFKKGEKRKAVISGGSILFFILLAGIHSPLLDVGLIKMPPIIAASFIFITLAASLELTNDAIIKSKLEGKLNMQMARWVTLLDNVQLFVVSVDTEGIITYVNPYCCDRIGLDCNRLIGTNWFKKFLVEEEQERVKNAMSEFIKGNNHKHFQNKILSSQGALDVYWTNVLLTDENGRPEGIIGVGADVSQREQAYKEIQALKDKLEMENIVLKETYNHFPKGLIIGESHAFIYAHEKALEVAPTQSIVLLEGETGVGKEVFARLIHENSQRSTKEFLKINCSAIPHELIESELFGHEKGSFTGAGKIMRRGIFERANGGTLFLDEIGELPINLQPKLLRVLQDGELQRVGGEKVIKTDVRIVAATNRILYDEIEKGTFRKDLFFRLNVFPITIPPLRKRKEDIRLFIDHFVQVYSTKYEKKINRISKHTYESFQNYHWPGNIRELQNVIERAVILAKSDILKTNGLLQNGSGNGKILNKDIPIYSLEEIERQHIIRVLKESNWQIHGDGGAAQKLEVNPNTLRSKMKKLMIEKVQD